MEKGIYGLKQAPKEWNNVLDDYLKSLGFQQNKVDRCLYIKKDGKQTTLLGVFVDDILIASRHQSDNDTVIKA